MTKLEELIQELCPNGVEYRHLWELTIWDKKFNAVDRSKQLKVINYNYYLAADLKALEVENGTVKILTTSVTDLWADEDVVNNTLSEGEIVCIPWGGNPIVQYYKGKFITGDNRIATSIDIKILNNKYLYYVLQNRLAEIASFYRGSGIKHPDMTKVLDMEIPVPPLPVQNEIVRILDNFTKLTAELTARKKQYEYYRNIILFSSPNTQTKTLGDICDFVRGPFGGSLKKEIFTKSGYAVYEQQHAIYGDFSFRYFVDEKKFSEMKRFAVTAGDLIMSCSGTMGKIAIIPNDAPEGIINQALLKLTPKPGVNVKYLKYCFENTISAGSVKSYAQK